jgi:hypothetical protein
VVASISLRRRYKHELTGQDGKPFLTPTAMTPATVIVNVKRSAESDAAVELFGEHVK